MPETNEGRAEAEREFALICSAGGKALRADRAGGRTMNTLHPVMERVFRALYPKLMAEHECPKCERGLVDYLVAGSASKTEADFCDCAVGRARKADTNDALEAKGEERGR